MSYIDRKETRNIVLLLEQSFSEGKYMRNVKELEFVDKSGPIVKSENVVIQDFVKVIDPKLFITGILIDKDFAIILINFKGVNKLCKTSESDAKVRHSLIEFFFLMYN